MASRVEFVSPRPVSLCELKRREAVRTTRTQYPLMWDGLDSEQASVLENAIANLPVNNPLLVLRPNPAWDDAPGAHTRAAVYAHLSQSATNHDQQDICWQFATWGDVAAWQRQALQIFPDAFAASPSAIPYLHQSGIPPRQLIRFADAFIVRKVTVKTRDVYHNVNFFYG